VFVWTEIALAMNQLANREASETGLCMRVTRPYDAHAYGNAERATYRDLNRHEILILQTQMRSASDILSSRGPDANNGA
jgi:hypothetical protein